MNYTYKENDLKEYEAAIGYMKKEERQYLREWVVGGNSVQSNPFYVYGDDGRLIDYISAFRHCIKEHKKELRKELKEYETSITDLTDEEKSDLRKWVAAGNSVKSNPYEMCDGGCRPLDYIEAIRITEDMRQNPKDYGIGVEPETAIEYVPEDGIPF